MGCPQCFEQPRSTIRDEHCRRNRFRSQPGGDILGNRLPMADMAADLLAYFGEIRRGGCHEIR